MCALPGVGVNVILDASLRAIFEVSMNRLMSRVRQPVKREDAEHYLLLALLSFAASVTLTRLFLQLTGYPQVGGGELHIAHMLWGGLLLFVAALLPLMFANRWVYTAGALLAGAGVGLFIDEVGKFITKSNDYFYPAAAPIIYAFFLLTVLLYLRIRRPPSRDARSELYRVFDGLQEVLDRDLDPQERADLEARLRSIAVQEEHPDLARLANELEKFIASDSLYLVPRTPSVWERFINRLQLVQARYLTRRRLKVALVVGLGALSVQALFDPLVIALTVLLPGDLSRTLPNLLDLGYVRGSASLMGFRFQLALEGAIGVLLLASCILLLVQQERRAMLLGYFALLMSLTTVNLLVFFYEQFSTIALALLQLGLLMTVIHYRRRHLAPRRADG
jgi:hypothetical protein